MQIFITIYYLIEWNSCKFRRVFLPWNLESDFWIKFKVIHWRNSQRIGPIKSIRIYLQGEIAHYCPWVRFIRVFILYVLLRISFLGICGAKWDPAWTTAVFTCVFFMLWLCFIAIMSLVSSFFLITFRVKLVKCKA